MSAIFNPNTLPVRYQSASFNLDPKKIIDYSRELQMKKGSDPLSYLNYIIELARVILDDKKDTLFDKKKVKDLLEQVQSEVDFLSKLQVYEEIVEDEFDYKYPEYRERQYYESMRKNELENLGKKIKAKSNEEKPKDEIAKSTGESVPNKLVWQRTKQDLVFYFEILKAKGFLSLDLKDKDFVMHFKCYSRKTGLLEDIDPKSFKAIRDKLKAKFSTNRPSIDMEGIENSF